MAAHFLHRPHRLRAEGDAVVGFESLRLRPRHVFLQIFLGRVLQAVDLLGAFEIARVDDGRGDEDELLEVVRKRPVDRQDLVQPEAGEGRDADDRRRLARVELRRSDLAGLFRNGDRHQDLIEPLHVSLHAAVVPMDGETERDGGAGDQDGDPTSLRKFLERGDDEDA